MTAAFLPDEPSAAEIQLEVAKLQAASAVIQSHKANTWGAESIADEAYLVALQFVLNHLKGKE